MTWYQFGWFEAYLATNRLDDVLALADATLKSNPYAEEMYLYKGFVFQKRGDANAAREQFNLALQHNPNLARARQALETLKP
jgi:tetratricopeptide (TPR) repeat protein